MALPADRSLPAPPPPSHPCKQGSVNQPLRKHGWTPDWNWTQPQRLTLLFSVLLKLHFIFISVFSGISPLYQTNWGNNEANKNIVRNWIKSLTLSAECHLIVIPSSYIVSSKSAQKNPSGAEFFLYPSVLSEVWRNKWAESDMFGFLQHLWSAMSVHSVSNIPLAPSNIAAPKTITSEVLKISCSLTDFT